MLVAGIYSALPAIIRVAGWIVAVVFGAVMVSNGGAKPERCFLVGACLMLASSVVTVFGALLYQWLLQELGYDLTGVVRLMTAVSIVGSLTGLSGIILLAYAFWQKFKAPAPV